MNKANILIINAFIFDGYSLRKGLNVVMENGLIHSIDSSNGVSNEAKNRVASANIVDGKGLTLLPGFIDCHIHLDTDLDKGNALLA